MGYKVPKGPLKDVVLDLDDLSQEEGNSADAMDLLFMLKVMYPKLKVTLFGIPFHKGKSNEDFFHDIFNKHGDWIQLGIHGWEHKETEWPDIERAYKWGCFQKLYKAPEWKLSKETAEVLNSNDIIIAELKTKYGKKSYDLSHPWCVHGHTWNLNNPDPEYNNGIEQIIKRGVPWDGDTNFHFITELYD